MRFWTKYPSQRNSSPSFLVANTVELSPHPGSLTGNLTEGSIHAQQELCQMSYPPSLIFCLISLGISDGQKLSCYKLNSDLHDIKNSLWFQLV